MIHAAIHLIPHVQCHLLMDERSLGCVGLVLLEHILVDERCCVDHLCDHRQFRVPLVGLEIGVGRAANEQHLWVLGRSPPMCSNCRVTFKCAVSQGNL